MRLRNAIKYTLEKLKGFPIYEMEAFCLLKYVTGLNDLELLTCQEFELNEEQITTLDECISRRLSHEPIAYIIQEKEFYGYTFKVNNSTLIPRPETEILVSSALQIVEENNMKSPKILEIGVGSGAVILSILKELPEATAVGIDISEEALNIANENALSLGVSTQIEFIHSDLFEKLSDSDFDIIISNPPYIESSEIANLSEGVKNFEPTLALDGGEDGLNFYSKIIQQSPDFLKEKGHLLLEIGYSQKNSILSMLYNNTWESKKCFKDLSNNDRIIISKLIN